MSVDLETTPELLAEGLARDVIRLVQRARRDAGLHVTDRIRLVVALPEEPAAAIQPWLDHIAAQVLGLELMIEALIDQDSKPADRDGWFMAAGELPDGGSVVVQVQRVDAAGAGPPRARRLSGSPVGGRDAPEARSGPRVRRMPGFGLRA